MDELSWKYLFWGSFALLFYAYAGYPCVIWLLERIFYKPVKKGEITPDITVLITAYNEEEKIGSKIENIFASDYPQNKIKIIVASDGSTDKTCEIVKAYADKGVRLLEYPKRRGKASVLNDAVMECDTDIVICADARQMLAPDCLRQVVSNFNDEQVGAVSGELVLTQPGSEGIAKGMGFYWKYEKFIRKCESGIHSTIGATGALLAFRKGLWKGIPDNTVVDDMVFPFKVIDQNKRVVLEDGAHVYDVASTSWDREFVRKIRTLGGNFQILFNFRQMGFSIFNPLMFQFISHKVMRLLGPLAMLAMFWSSYWLLKLANWRGDSFSLLLYGTILSVQGVFYLGSIIGFIAEKFSVKIPCATIAYSFVLTQIAIVCGFLRYSSGREDVMWDKTLSYSSTGGIHNRIIRLLSDSTLFCFGIIVSFYLRYRGTPPEHIFSLFANLNPTFEIFETNFAIPLVMLVPLSVFYFFKLNETRTRDVTPEFILTIAKSVFFTTIVMMLLIYNMRNVFTIAYEGKVASFPTAVLVMSFFINCFILAGWRFILKNIIYPAKNKKDTKTRTTVFSNAEISSLYLNKIQNRLEKFNSNLEAVSARSLPEVENIKTLGNVSEEINNMSPDKTDWLWLDTQSIHKDEVLIAIDNAEKYGIHTSAIPGDLEAVVGGKRLQLISYIPVINVANKPLNEGVVFIKKGFDIISALIMFFIGLPGAFIYVISGGKFHRNAFYGMHGKKLNILRLSGNKANKGIIAFSAKILCWSWHILKGDFSLVGYMPIPESIWRKSSALEKSFCTMRPGIITPERLSFIKREKIRRSFISVVCYTKNFHLGKDLNIIANYFFKGK